MEEIFQTTSKKGLRSSEKLKPRHPTSELEVSCELWLAKPTGFDQIVFKKL